MLAGMKTMLRGLWIACCLGTLTALAQTPAVAPPPPVSPIPPTEFRGWPKAYVLKNDRVEAVFVPAIGRLVHFSAVGGPSLFRLESSLQGQTPPAGERFFNVGGDWLWPVAQARWASLSADGSNWPPPAPLADRPWKCSAWTDVGGAQCALLTRKYGPPLNVLVTRLFRLDPESSALVVRQRIERTGAPGVPVVLWNVSQIAKAESIAMPVEAESKFRNGVKALMGRKPTRKRLVPCGDAVVYAVAPGAETKLGSDSPRGWIAAACGPRVVFESVANGTAGAYPDGGCVVEVYSNEGLGYSEIETLGPEVDLARGTVLENVLRIELATAESPLAGCAFADFLRPLAGK